MKCRMLLNIRYGDFIPISPIDLEEIEQSLPAVQTLPTSKLENTVTDLAMAIYNREGVNRAVLDFSEEKLEFGRAIVWMVGIVFIALLGELVYGFYTQGFDGVSAVLEPFGEEHFSWIYWSIVTVFGSASATMVYYDFKRAFRPEWDSVDTPELQRLYAAKNTINAEIERRKEAARPY